MKGRRKLKLTLLSILTVFLLLSFGYSSIIGATSAVSVTPFDTVGYLYDHSTLSRNTLPVLMPYNKVIDPAGKQIYFGDPELENHALDCSLSPDNKILAVEGRYSVVFIDTQTERISYRLKLNKYKNTYSGITWSKDGKDVFWSTSSDVLEAEIENDGSAKVIKAFHFNAKNPSKLSLPNELVLSKDGRYLFVVLNGNNELAKIDLMLGSSIWKVPIGMVPYGITLANGKLYVTNWAGPVPTSSDVVAKAPWENIVVNPKTGAAALGSVSVVDPQTGKVIKEIEVGLHPNDIINSPDGKYVYVANANSDTVSVIRTDKDVVSETIPVKLTSDFDGDSPDGLGISPDGKTLYVANGMDNAIAVVKLGTNANSNDRSKASEILGFIPTEAYPGSIAVSKGGSMLYVTNIEAIGARETIYSGDNKAYYTYKKAPVVRTNGYYTTHRMLASISIIKNPDIVTLGEYTERVRKTNLVGRMYLSKLISRKDIKPVPVPKRIGEPSVFKHVIYIIKENRSYDQVFGDMKEGDGDPYLCAFGEKVTPNQHELAQEFELLDNYYASGKCSAEGHQWTDSGMVTDYIEKSVRAWFRSYPHVQTDAMVYPTWGFIWNDALKHGKTIRIYGEAATPHWTPAGGWKDLYEDFVNHGNKFKFWNTTTIDDIKPYLSPVYPGYDSHNIPDVLRASRFIKELKEYESKPDDQLPNLIIIALPDDHTAGTRPGFPTPRAQVADNDLALGQIIDAVSHSKFWPTTAIFVTEDDPQDGWDHVSAYRTTGFVVSPYSALEKVVHTNYNQVSMLRTIEQILGLPPMSKEDASASPMFDCFTNIPNLAPYTVVPNQIPLNEMNLPLSQLKGKALYYAKLSSNPEFSRIDSGNDEELNRIIWFSTMGNKPYPTTLGK